MLKKTVLPLRPHKNRLASFTLVELLTVMAIILILAGLILSAASGVMEKAKRTRAQNEIQGMSAALEGYKTDNGIYPSTNVATSFGMQNSTLLTNSAAALYFSTTLDGTSSQYQQTSQVLYLGLTGQTNFTDTPAAGAKAVKDPWGYSYGYSVGSATSAPINGVGFFDLWSTGGNLAAKVAATPTLTNSWISNWQ